MIGMIHDATVVNTGRKDRKTNLEIKKLYATVQYSKFMEDVDRADQYLSFHSVLRETVKLLKKVVLYLLNCTLFSAFFVYRTLNTNKKVKYTSFLCEVGRSWISEVQNETKSSLMTFNCQTSKKHQGGLERISHAHFPGISEYTNWKAVLLVGREKRSILQDTVKYVLHIRVKLDTLVNSVLVRFPKGPCLRSTIQ